jgi:hypothetical protein
MFRKVKLATAMVVVCCAVAPLAARAADVDLSTPKAAAKTFGQGLSDGDAETVKAAAIANEDQVKALEALVRAVSNFKKVEEAAVAKFGDAGKSIANPGSMSIGDELAKIDTAEEKIDGDSATLTPAESTQPLQLRKIDGQWKVDFAAMPGSEQAAEALPMINAMADAATELADEISADKYKTAEEAKTALKQKLLAAMMAAQGNAATSEPAATEDSGGMMDDSQQMPTDDAVDAPNDMGDAPDDAAPEPPDSGAQEPAATEEPANQ